MVEDILNEELLMHIYTFILIVILILVNFINSMYNKHMRNKMISDPTLYTKYLEMLDSIILEQSRVYIMNNILRPKHMRDYSFDKVAISDAPADKEEYLQGVIDNINIVLTDHLRDCLTYYCKSEALDAFIRQRTEMTLFPIIASLYKTKRGIPAKLNEMLQRESVGDDDELTDEHLRLDPETKNIKSVVDIYYKKAGEMISNDEAKLILEEMERIKHDAEEISIIEEMGLGIPNSTFAAKLDILKRIVLPPKDELD